MCVCVGVNMSTCVPMESEECARYLGMGVTGLEMNLSPLQEQYRFLSTEPSL